MARMNTPEMELALLLQEANSRLQSEWRAKKHFADVNQRKIARTLGRNRRAMNGLGRVRMEVDTEVYHYYGQRYGYKCWKDEGFLKWHEQRHPELKVECRGTKEIQVGWQPADKRYHKRSDWGRSTAVAM